MVKYLETLQWLEMVGISNVVLDGRCRRPKRLIQMGAVVPDEALVALTDTVDTLSMVRAVVDALVLEFAGGPEEAVMALTKQRVLGRG